MNSTRQSIVRFFSLACALILFGSAGRAQDPFQDAIKQLSSDNVRGYLQPFVNGLGANLNTGFYSSAQIGDMGLHLQIGIVGMGTLVGDAEKVYNAIPPKPFPQTGVQTATLFGGQGATVAGPGGSQDHFQAGQARRRTTSLVASQSVCTDWSSGRDSLRRTGRDCRRARMDPLPIPERTGEDEYHPPRRPA